MIKKQGLKLKFKPLAHDGWHKFIKKEQKIVIDYSKFLEHREEILARKDITHQLWLMMKIG